MMLTVGWGRRGARPRGWRAGRRRPLGALARLLAHPPGFPHCSRNMRWLPSAARPSQANPAVAFARWQAAHGKTYKSTREAERRRAVFAANAATIAAQNARPDSSLRLALNEYADLTWEEFSAARLGLKPDLAAPKQRWAEAGGPLGVVGRWLGWRRLERHVALAAGGGCPTPPPHRSPSP